VHVVYVCRIPASKIALNKSQFDAMLVRVSRGLRGSAECIPEAVEAHTECVQATESNSCTTEVVSAVVSPQMQVCQVSAQTDSAVNGMP